MIMIRIYIQTDYFADHPSSNYQVVCFDNRGVGLSDCPLERITTQKLAQDAIKLCDHLGWNEFHVVGISMGGMISLELATMAQHRVVSLSLLCTHAGGITSLPILPSAALVTAKATLANTQEQRIHCAMELLYGKKTLANPIKYRELFEHHKQRLTKRVAPKFFGTIGQLLAVATHYVSWSKLAQIKNAAFPKLIMVGTEDKLVREINSYLLHKAIGGTFTVLDGAGHGFLVEMPDEVNTNLQAVFERGTTERKRLYVASKMSSDDDDDNCNMLIPYGSSSESQSLIDLATVSWKMSVNVHRTVIQDVLNQLWDSLTARFPLP
jgi:pimeloyl-ACP methyl ester carboxylesterase